MVSLWQKKGREHVSRGQYRTPGDAVTAAQAHGEGVYEIWPCDPTEANLAFEEGPRTIRVCSVVREYNRVPLPAA